MSESTVMTIEDDIVGTHEVKKRSFYQIDKRFIPAKLAYLLIYSVSGCISQYLGVFLISIGLSASQAGFINGICGAMTVLAGPFWGGLADYTGFRKLIVTIISLLSVVLMVPLPWIADQVHPLYQNKSLCGNNSANMSLILGKNKTCSFTTNTLFYTMLFMLALARSFYSSLPIVVDAAVVNIDTGNDKKINYGRQRFFGGVGFGFGSFMTGVSADNYNHPTLSRYTAIFFVFPTAILLFVPTGNLLLHQINWSIQRQREKRIPFFRPVLNVYSRIRNVMFLLIVIVIGTADGMLNAYLFMLMEEEMKARRSLMGICTVIACLSEAIMYPFAAKIIRFLGGSFPCFVIALLSHFVRLFCISYIKNPILVLPAQTLHSCGYGLFWAAAVDHTNNISTKEISTVMFGVTTSFRKLGGIISALLGGVLYENIGGRILFRGASIVYGMCGLLTLIYCYVTRNGKEKRISKKEMDVVNIEMEDKKRLFK